LTASHEAVVKTSHLIFLDLLYAMVERIDHLMKSMRIMVFSNIKWRCVKDWIMLMSFLIYGMNLLPCLWKKRQKIAKITPAYNKCGGTDGCHRNRRHEMRVKFFRNSKEHDRMSGLSQSISVL
jgi:hypothetical protein